ncbi:MAG: hypothetical protein FE043_02065 [Thermoplasmata archaeon]|nr:MAG: hypothetical protein FE043_02065 [Thermoplasmata archaeon]
MAKVHIFAGIVFLMMIANIPMGIGAEAGREGITNNFTHTVFCELGVDSQSDDSSAVDKILHSIYLSGEHPFYYVTMPSDKFEVANHRLEGDYNIYGYPTCFFDGGNEVAYGLKDESYYEKKISEAGSRDVPDLSIEVLANWIQCPCQVGLFVEAYVTNSGGEKYNGRLAVYIAEINSRWTDSNGIPYHFGFMGYAINEQISVNAYGKHYSSGYWNPPAYGFEHMLEKDMENIIAIGVIFNGTHHNSYALPPDENPFKAYYVDGVASDRVFDVDLPPVAKITSPVEGSIYFFGREIAKINGNKAIIIGKILIGAYADDDIGIKKVEFYVDEELKHSDEKPPYSWTWDDSAVGSHTIKISAYDNSGNKTNDTKNLIILNI